VDLTSEHDHAASPPLDDRTGILELFARYAWALDTADFDAFLGTFVPDGVLVQVRADGSNTFAGAARLRKFATGLCGASWFPGRQHHVGNIVFGAGRPGVWWELCAYVLVTQARQASVTVEFSGYYHDECVKHGSTWAFRLRRYQAWADAARTLVRAPIDLASHRAGSA